MRDKDGRTPYVVGFAFDEIDGDHRVALIEKRRPAWQRGLLNGIGGHVEEGELPIEAMAREFEEETGMATLEGEWTHFATVTTARSRVAMFAADLRELRLASRTDERVIVILVDDVPKWATVPNLAWLVPLARRAGDLLAPVEVRERARYETGS